MLLHRRLFAAILMAAVGFGEAAQADDMGRTDVRVGGALVLKFSGGRDAKAEYGFNLGAGVADGSAESRNSLADQLKSVPLAEFKHYNNSDQFSSFLNSKDNPWVCLTTNGERQCGWLQEFNLQLSVPPNLVPQFDPQQLAPTIEVPQSDPPPQTTPERSLLIRRK
jgi:hypothetical protein